MIIIVLKNTNYWPYNDFALPGKTYMHIYVHSVFISCILSTYVTVLETGYDIFNMQICWLIYYYYYT